MSEITLDFETENLNLGLGRPWQLAFIVADKGQVRKGYDLLIDIDDLNVSAKAAQISRFDWGKYNQSKIPAEEAVSILEPYLLDEKNKIIGHNILGFDLYILGNLYKYIGREFDFKKIIYRVYDTLSIARAQHFQSPPPKDRKDFLAWQYKHLHKFDKAVKTNLAALARRNDIEVDDDSTHDATYDVTITYKIFKKLEYALDLP